MLLDFMRKLLTMITILLSITSFTSDKSIVGEWEYIHDYVAFDNEDYGYTEKFERVVIEILNQTSCTAFSESYLNENEVSGSKEECLIKDGKIKVLNGKSSALIVSGMIKAKGNKLDVVEIKDQKKKETVFNRI